MTDDRYIRGIRIWKNFKMSHMGLIRMSRFLYKELPPNALSYLSLLSFMALTCRYVDLKIIFVRHSCVMSVMDRLLAGAGLTMTDAGR